MKKHSTTLNQIHLQKHKSLLKGLLSISSKKIIPLKNSILESYDKLYWKIDDGEYYEQYSNIGRNYKWKYECRTYWSK